MIFADVLKKLMTFLGRPLIAHMINVKDVNDITRLRMGKIQPTEEQINKINFIYNLSEKIKSFQLNENDVRNWLTGANPVLGDMPANFIKENKLEEVIIAFNSWISETY